MPERSMLTLLKVHLQPRASTEEIVATPGEIIRVRVTAPPVEGRANAALVELLADALRLPRSRVSIFRGQRSRQKTVCVTGLTIEEVHQRLGRPVAEDH